MIFLRGSSKINSKIGKFSKVVLGVLVAAVAIVPSFACGVAAKAAPVKETSKIVGMKLNKCFPDSTFARYVYEEVLGHDEWKCKGADYHITDADADVIGSYEIINFSGRGCTSLDGIEYFTQLEELDCSNNLLKTLVVSGCRHLSTLRCSSNMICYLNFSGCTLINLDCSKNPIYGDLNMACCADTESIGGYINCSDTNIKNIRIPSGKSSISYINASRCYNLEGLSAIYTDGLVDVNLSNCSSLKSVCLMGCKDLRSVNVSHCRDLYVLDLLQSDDISTVGIDGCENLKWLKISPKVDTHSIFGLELYEAK